jgi:O-antigen/teichoic acid export membrane protein
MSLSQQAISASKWSVLAEFSARGIPPITYLTLAFLLTPEDFGIVAICTMIINFSQMVWEAGLSKALIQREADLNNSANVVFWINFFFGIVMYGVLLICALPISNLLNEPKVFSAIQVQGVVIILSAFSSVFVSIFERSLDFKPIFRMRVATSVLPGVASIFLAVEGFEYWAMIYGSILGACAQLAMLWHSCAWRPRLYFDIQIAKALLTFGSWVTVENILSWLFHWADTILVGFYFGTHSLGLYRTGYTIINSLYGVFFNPLLSVLFSALSRIHNDLPRITNILLRISKFFAFVSLPVGGILFLHSGNIDEIVPPHWSGIGNITGWLGLMYGLSWGVGANSTVYRSIGRPDVNAKIMIFTIAYYIPIYYLSLNHGMSTFLQVRFGLTIVSILVQLIVARHVLLIPITRSFFNFDGILIAASSMVVFMYFLELRFASLLMQIIITTVCCVSLYLLFSFRQWPFIMGIARSYIKTKEI